jgi:hypothetical protein
MFTIIRTKMTSPIPTGFAIPSTLPALLILLVGLVIVWIIVSIPVYIAGELITEGKAAFGDAMGATLGGAILYLIVLFGGIYFLTPLLGASAVALSFLLALLGWLAVYRASFNTGWLGAIGIVILAWTVLFVLDVVLTSLFGISFPKFYPF